MDKTIRIWDINEYKEIQTLEEGFNVWSLLKLKNQNEMIASGNEWSMSFWNTTTFKKEHIVECCDCTSLNGLIELPNHRVAVSGGLSSTIDVINTETYQLIKQITCEGYIVSGDDGYSSLRLLSNGTFVNSRKGCFCQISSTTYEVLFKDKKEKEFRGETITSILNGKYIIAKNLNKNISIFKVNYN